MAFISLSGSVKKSESSPRWFAGVNVTTNCRRIEAAMIGVHGKGSGAPVEIRRALSFDLPSEITEVYNELQEAVADGGPGNDFLPLYFHVVRELASVEEEAIEELLNESQLSKSDVLAVGIHDAGIRRSVPGGLFYRSLCDATFLAERTGMNIVDAFPAQDIAALGDGGPVLPLPTWVFLKSESRDRILLDLGRTARLMFLPKAENAFSHQRIKYRDIVPCGSLLDALTWESTQGKTMIDIGGRLTVQGCQIPKLLDEFRAIALPKRGWNPLGLSPKPFLKTASRLIGAEHSSQDVLCTASCFVAEVVAESLRSAVEEFSQGSDLEPELLLTGSGRMHGMLMNLISTQLEHKSMVPITKYGFPTETFDALCVAMLTLMAVDHIPSNLPVLTGSETSKSLGRLTPGCMTSWHRLLQEMAQTKPVVRPLRSAV